MLGWVAPVGTAACGDLALLLSCIVFWICYWFNGWCFEAHTKKTHISRTNGGMKEWPSHYLLACDFFLERYPNSPRFAGSAMIFCQQNNAFYSALFNSVSVGVFRAWCVHFFSNISSSTNPKQWWICWLTSQRNHLSCETHHLWGASLRKWTPWMIILLKCIARGPMGACVTFQDWLGFCHNSTHQETITYPTLRKKKLIFQTAFGMRYLNFPGGYIYI